MILLTPNILVFRRQNIKPAYFHILALSRIGKIHAVIRKTEVKFNVNLERTQWLSLTVILSSIRGAYMVGSGNRIMVSKYVTLPNRKQYINVLYFALPNLTQIIDIVGKAPKDNSYDILKRPVISHLSDSQGIQDSYKLN
ncbi:hypothetical protein ACTXT7_006298 [Hymenolepis weldensis]